MRPSSARNRRIVLIGLLTGVLLLPSSAWARGPDKGDDHPSNGRGSGAPEWASQGPPAWAMNESAPPPWAAAACDPSEREACRAESDAVREQFREERRAIRDEFREERRALKRAWHEARALARGDRIDEPTDLV